MMNNQDKTDYDNAFNSEFKIMNMCTRPVFYRNYSAYFDRNMYDKEHRDQSYRGKCSDCKAEPKITIYELDGSSWLWCGVCQVG